MFLKTSAAALTMFLGVITSCSPAQENRHASASKQTVTTVVTTDTDVPPVASTVTFKKGRLLYKDTFEGDLSDYVIETPASPNSSIGIEDNKLVIDVDGGATVWLNKKLSGNLLIEYTRKVVMDGGKNNRLSDLNQFWMATDPDNPNLFTRTGVFKEYDKLLMYYAGVGGNTNSTTRFRKYAGTGDRVLHTDLQDKEHLLEPNKTYRIKTIVYNGTTKFFVDDKEYFSFQDPDPLLSGYFGFRTTESRHVIDNLEIYALE